MDSSRNDGCVLGFQREKPPSPQSLVWRRLLLLVKTKNKMAVYPCAGKHHLTYGSFTAGSGLHFARISIILQ